VGGEGKAGPAIAAGPLFFIVRAFGVVGRGQYASAEWN
jgi:hypothetical protein